jgi:ABC-type nitrate/sulfonate/bicarbonate transport system permease component
MPLLLYSVKDSGMTAFLVVFMASLWPTLANTAFGVANIKKEYLNVAAILQMSPAKKLVSVILPAAGPTIVPASKFPWAALGLQSFRPKPCSALWGLAISSGWKWLN